MRIPFLNMDPVLFVLILVLGGLPAYYINKYLVRLTRPRESMIRMLAYFIILLATALIYTAIMFVLLRKYLYKI